MTCSGTAALATLVAAVLTLALASAASATKITLGPSLDDPGIAQVGLCAPPCTVIQSELAAGTGILTAPVSGQITAWSLRGGEAAGGHTYAIRTLAPVSGSSYRGLATSAAIPGMPSTVVNESATSIPIQAGQRVALKKVTGPDGGFPVYQPPAAGPSDAIQALGDFPDGALGMAGAEMPNRRLAFNVEVTFCRVPDVFRRPVEAARQLILNADCGILVRKRKLRPNRKNRKRKGRVLLQATPAGTTGPPGTPVDITIVALRKRR